MNPSPTTSPIEAGVSSPSIVLGEGDSATVWSEAGVHPLTSLLTRTAAAARTVGFQLLTEKSYSHSLEDDGSPEGRRETNWVWAAGQTATFRPNFPEETISLREFAARFQDLEWVKANPDHPIAHMRWYLEILGRTLDEVKRLGTCEKIRRDLPGSKVFCLIPPDATDEERAEIIAEMNGLLSQ